MQLDTALYFRVSQTYFHGGTLKIIVHMPKEPLPMKTNKETVVCALRLFQYLQLTDKNPRDISRYIYNFFRCIKLVEYLFHNFSRNPVTMYCGTLFEKHSSISNYSSSPSTDILYAFQPLRTTNEAQTHRSVENRVFLS